MRTFGFVESNAGCVILVQERALDDLSERIGRDEFRPSPAVLLEIFLQITEAMICLADNQIVHGDLACRNVLVYELDEREPSRISVKLTDFGLTRVSTLASTTTIIPIRYAAPELLANQPLYSEKSDVYSMGVLMWEVFSPPPQLPFSAIGNDEEVRQRKLQGEVLDKPGGCEEALWTIITQCWQKRPNDRPTFKALKESLLKLKFQHLLR